MNGVDGGGGRGSRRAAGAAGLMVLVLLASGPGCDPAAQCSSDKECRPGHACLQLSDGRACVVGGPPCEADPDCPGLHQCVDNQCVDRGHLLVEDAGPGVDRPQDGFGSYPVDDRKAPSPDGLMDSYMGCSDPPCDVQDVVGIDQPGLDVITVKPVGHNVIGLEQDSTHVYWAITGDQTTAFYRLAKGSSQAEALVTTDTRNLRAFAVQGEQLFWLADSAAGAPGLWSAPLLGSPALMTSTGTTSRGQSLIVEPDAVYWIESDGPSAGQLMALPRAEGATSAALATFTDETPTALVLAGPLLVGSACQAGCRLWTVPRAGGVEPSTLVARSTETLQAVSFDPSTGSTFFATSSGQIRRVNPAENAGLPQTYVSENALTDRLVVDVASLHWFGGAPRTLYSTPTTGGAVGTLVDPRGAAYGLVLDSTEFYWLNEGLAALGPVTLQRLAR